MDKAQRISGNFRLRLKPHLATKVEKALHSFPRRVTSMVFQGELCLTVAEASTVRTYLERFSEANFVKGSEDARLFQDLVGVLGDFVATPLPPPAPPTAGEVDFTRSEAQRFEAESKRKRDEIFRQIFGTPSQRDVWGNPIKEEPVKVEERPLMNGGDITFSAGCGGSITITAGSATGTGAGGNVLLMATGGNLFGTWQNTTGTGQLTSTTTTNMVGRGSHAETRVVSTVDAYREKVRAAEETR